MMVGHGRDGPHGWRRCLRPDGPGSGRGRNGPGRGPDGQGGTGRCESELRGLSGRTKFDVAEEAASQVQPIVRTNFADTAFWAAALATGPDGIAEVDFALPESLTTWKVKSWAMGLGTKVGQGESEIVTTKDLLVRLQAPRFFVEKDEVVLSANVHNKLKTKKTVQVVLEFDGSVLQPLGETARTVAIAAGSEHRVDWRVKVAHEGQAVIRMKALTDEESDAAQMTFPAYVHGMLKTEAFAGTIRPDQETAKVTLRVPAERKPEQSRLEVRYSPTLAGALVDALPYLADYPYGCTEQTMNRFLPTVITQKVLIDLGLDLKAIHAKHTNLNAQELGDARDRAKKWQGYEHNPVFDQEEVARMSRAGLQRLADMQLSDGGWGWFSGFGEHSSAHTTALVVHGLQVARRNDLALPQEMLERGVAWLSTYQAGQVQLLDHAESKVDPRKPSADDLDAMVFMVLTDDRVHNEQMLGFLDRDRTKLSVYGKALFGLGLERLGEKEKLADVLQNIGQYVVRDDENQTAYLKLPNQGYWWWWYGSEIETHAFYLKLLARTDPRGELAPRLVKYVLNNRRHCAYWNSTRDTAFCVEAMAEYLKASGEDRPEMTVTVAIDGRSSKEVKITPADLFAFDNGFALEGPALSTGEHTVTLTRKGKGPLYFNAYLTNFTMEDPITRAGLEIKVDRKVYRLVRGDKTVDAAGGHGQAVGQRVERYRRELLADGATLKSGDLVEVELEIDSKNDYEYLVFEDYKAAGFEPVEVRSGYNGNDLGAYVEFRDERVAFFARSLARGKHSVAYRLRAEIPGRFHALPARAQAMYAPELRANSDEIQLRVQDCERPEEGRRPPGRILQGDAARRIRHLVPRCRCPAQASTSGRGRRRRSHGPGSAPDRRRSGLGPADPGRTRAAHSRDRRRAGDRPRRLRDPTRRRVCDRRGVGRRGEVRQRSGVDEGSDRHARLDGGRAGPRGRIAVRSRHLPGRLDGDPARRSPVPPGRHGDLRHARSSEADRDPARIRRGRAGPGVCEAQGRAHGGDRDRQGDDARDRRGRRADPAQPAGRIRRLLDRRPALLRPGLRDRGRGQEADRGLGRRGRRHHALPQPPLGQPHRQGDHVHRRLPVRRRPERDHRAGRLHVARRHHRDPPQLACIDPAHPRPLRRSPTLSEPALGGRGLRPSGPGAPGGWGQPTGGALPRSAFRGTPGGRRTSHDPAGELLESESRDLNHGKHGRTRKSESGCISLSVSVRVFRG